MDRGASEKSGTPKVNEYFVCFIEWQLEAGEYWIQRYEINASDANDAASKAISEMTSAERLIPHMQIPRKIEVFDKPLASYATERKSQPLFELGPKREL